MTDKLKPCLFCGGKARIVQEYVVALTEEEYVEKRKVGEVV